jgi:hypothetical protein
LEERGVGASVRGAGAVAPDEDGPFFSAGGFRRIVDCVAGEGGVGFVGAGRVGAGAAALLGGC